MFLVLKQDQRTEACRGDVRRENERRLRSCRWKLTCTEGKEKALGGAPLKQGGDTARHSLVALVDELLAKVAVDLLCRGALVIQQRAVQEVRELRHTERSDSESCMSQVYIHVLDLTA